MAVWSVGIWSASHKIGRNVDIKILVVDLLAWGWSLASSKTECSIMAEIGNRYYKREMFMEFCSGSSLDGKGKDNREANPVTPQLK